MVTTIKSWYSVTFVILICVIICILSHISAVIIEAEEGSNITINCNVTQSSDLAIFWKKNGSEILLQQGNVLYLPDINRTEAGNYMCYSFNKTYETEVNATEVGLYTVDVLYLAEITSFSIEPTTLVYNNTFTLNCTIEGNPEPELSIFSNLTGNLLYSGTGIGTTTVESPLAGCDEAGTWICTGANYLNKGYNTSRSENVTVYCPPKQKPPKPYSWKVEARTGEPAYIIVDNWGYPEPNYTWSRQHGTTVVPILTHYDGGTFSIINITSVDLFSFGLYWVKMENSYGVDTAEFQLVPYGMPAPPSNLETSYVRYTSVELDWDSGFDMGSRQYFIVYYWDNGTESFQQTTEEIQDYSPDHGVGEHFSHNYYGLQPGTDYILTIGAFNEHGGPVFSNNVSFRTWPKEKPTDKGLSTVTIAGIVVGSVVGGLVALSGIMKVALNSKKTSISSEPEVSGKHKYTRSP